VEDFETGPEEFIMDIPEITEEPSNTLNDSSSSLEHLDQSSSDFDEENGEKTPPSQSLKPGMRAIVRRTCLPSRVVGDQGSLLAVLKKNVGKVPALLTFI
jgi:hypothetical protein